MLNPPLQLLSPPTPAFVPPCRSAPSGARDTNLDAVGGRWFKNMEKCYEKHHASGEYIKKNWKSQLSKFRRINISTCLVCKIGNGSKLKTRGNTQCGHCLQLNLQLWSKARESMAVTGRFFWAQHSYSYTVNKWRFPKMVVPSDHPF
jgi:hypothetical protein